LRLARGAEVHRRTRLLDPPAMGTGTADEGDHDDVCAVCDRPDAGWFTEAGLARWAGVRRVRHSRKAYLIWATDRERAR